MHHHCSIIHPPFSRSSIFLAIIESRVQFGTKIALHVKCSKKRFYFSSGGLFKQLRPESLTNCEGDTLLDAILFQPNICSISRQAMQAQKLGPIITEWQIPTSGKGINMGPTRFFRIRATLEHIK